MIFAFGSHEYDLISSHLIFLSHHTVVRQTGGLAVECASIMLVTSALLKSTVLPVVVAGNVVQVIAYSSEGPAVNGLGRISMRVMPE